MVAVFPTKKKTAGLFLLKSSFYESKIYGIMVASTVEMLEKMCLKHQEVMMIEWN